MPRRLLLAVPVALLAACAGGRARESLAPPELLVEVLPRLADVALDGAPVGRGTRAVPAPAPGVHRLTVVAEGYDPEERPLPEGPLAGARVAVALRPAGFGASRRLDYDEPEGLAQAAATLARAGRHRDAADYASRAAGLDPSLPLAQRALGDALAGLGRRDEARSAWGRYLRLAPDAPDAAAVERRMGEGRATFDTAPPPRRAPGS